MPPKGKPPKPRRGSTRAQRQANAVDAPTMTKRKPKKRKATMSNEKHKHDDEKHQADHPKHREEAKPKSAPDPMGQPPDTPPSPTEG